MDHPSHSRPGYCSQGSQGEAPRSEETLRLGAGVGMKGEERDKAEAAGEAEDLWRSKQNDDVTQEF